MTDPRDFDRHMDLERRMAMERQATDPVWAWVAGAIALVVVLVLVFAPGEPTQTASKDPANPATTGLAPTPTLTTPPRLPARDTPSTTGQAPQ